MTAYIRRIPAQTRLAVPGLLLGLVLVVLAGYGLGFALWAFRVPAVTSRFFTNNVLDLPSKKSEGEVVLAAIIGAACVWLGLTWVLLRRPIRRGMPAAIAAALPFMPLLGLLALVIGTQAQVTNTLVCGLLLLSGLVFGGRQIRQAGWVAAVLTLGPGILVLLLLIAIPKAFTHPAFFAILVSSSVALAGALAINTLAADLRTAAWRKIRHYGVPIVLGACAAAYTVIISVLAIQKVGHLAASYDLAIFDQAIWSTAQGHLFQRSAGLSFISHLRDHVSPILLVFVPFYWIRPDYRWLLVGQAFVLAIASAPLYRLVSLRLRSRALGVAFALAFLLHPAVQGPTLTDFHELAFAPLFLFSAFFCQERNRTWGYWVWVGLALSVKEDVALAVMALGLYDALVRKRWGRGLAAVAAGAGWFLICTQIIIPHYGGQGFLYNYAQYGTTYPEILRTLLLNPVYSLITGLQPDKVVYVLQLFAPFAFLSLLGWRAWILALLPGAELLLAQGDVITSFGSHYNLVAIAGWTLTAVEGAAVLLRWTNNGNPRPALAMGVLLAALASAYFWGVLPGSQNYPPAWAQTRPDRNIAVYTLRGMIPQGADLAADVDMTPFLAERPYLRALNFGVPSLPDDLIQQPEYVLIDTAPYYQHPSPVVRPAEVPEQLMRQSGYQLIAYDTGIALLKHAPGPPPPADAFAPLQQERSYTCGSLPSQTGTTCQAYAGLDKPGYLAFGPYITLPMGFYTVTFDTDSFPIQSQEAAALLQVTGAKGSSESVWAEQAVVSGTGKQIVRFYNAFSDHVLQFKIYFTGQGDVRWRKITIQRSAEQNVPYGVMMLAGGSLSLPGGPATLQPNGLVSADPAHPQPGFLISGPWRGLPAGQYVADFWLRTADNSSAAPVAHLDVGSNPPNPAWSGATKTLTGRDFATVNIGQPFRLPFTVTAQQALTLPIEYRVYNTAQAPISVERVVVWRVGDVPTP